MRKKLSSLSILFKRIVAILYGNVDDEIMIIVGSAKWKERAIPQTIRIQYKNKRCHCIFNVY